VPTYAKVEKGLLQLDFGGEPPSEGGCSGVALRPQGSKMIWLWPKSLRASFISWAKPFPRFACPATCRYAAMRSCPILLSDGLQSPSALWLFRGVFRFIDWGTFQKGVYSKPGELHVIVHQPRSFRAGGSFRRPNNSRLIHRPVQQTTA